MPCRQIKYQTLPREPRDNTIQLQQCKSHFHSFIRSPVSRSGNSTQLEKSLTRAQVGIFVGLGLGRECSVGGPEIDQGLHGFELVGSEHVERCCGQDEVTEATVELLLQVQVVERLKEVGPVKVGVDSEHLTEDSLTDFDKILGETRPLADPIGLTRVCQLGEGRCGDAGVVCIRDARWVSRENLGIVDFA